MFSVSVWVNVFNQSFPHFLFLGALGSLGNIRFSTFFAHIFFNLIKGQNWKNALNKKLEAMRNVTSYLAKMNSKKPNQLPWIFNEFHYNVY